MPENRKTVLLDTLENYRHVTVNDNMRSSSEVFSKLECEVLNDWFRSDAPTDLARWTDDLVSLVPDRLYRALRIDEPGAQGRRRSGEGRAVRRRLGSGGRAMAVAGIAALRIARDVVQYARARFKRTPVWRNGSATVL